ncbi:Nudix hydrolase 20, chloroplastic [Turnera subulata]|uniref:Nudix hydrolase 20, chloroplastic n=1 Tax=Turnera subulata TaxID=218843 RepID=A0A9Q0F228_9ROSI|nr:Nudix hydrolase 20, chloroplastic [Turnera subulata]
MACTHPHFLSHRIRFSFPSLHIPKTITVNPNTPLNPTPIVSPSLRSFAHSPSKPAPPSSPVVSGTISSSSFTWDDVVRISQPEYAPNDSSDLSGFFDKIKLCNRGSEMQSKFIPFVIEDQIVGYVHNGFVEHLKRFKDVFIFPQSDSYSGRFGGYVTVHSSLNSPESRTGAVAEVIKCFGEERLIPGIRNELYPVTPYFGAPVYFSLERAAAPYFGIKAYGVHMNGYVERDGEKFLWIGKRSQVKPTFPGMLDHLVAGGLPHGISSGENIIKECEEEAGIPESLSHKAIPVGAVSYMDIDGVRYKRDVLFCYDLKLPENFVPNNQDGEVESFKLIPVTNVANIIRRTQFFKPNCSLVIIDFLFRHGYFLVASAFIPDARRRYITPECCGYLGLLQSLRSGDCS